MSLATGLLVWGVLAMPPVRAAVESGLATHVLVYLPGLAAAGCAIGGAARRHWDRVLTPYNTQGIPGLLLAGLAIAFWLAPRSLDAALLDGRWEAAKLVSVPLLVGVPLGLSWPRMGVVGRGFVCANLAAMLAAMGVVYLAWPERLCASYLIGEQHLLGRGLLAAGAGLAVAGLFVVLRAGRHAPDSPPVPSPAPRGSCRDPRSPERERSQVEQKSRQKHEHEDHG